MATKMVTDYLASQMIQAQQQSNYNMMATSDAYHLQPELNHYSNTFVDQANDLVATAA
jgi:hypothetical protein